jgi:hypothetical protein
VTDELAELERVFATKTPAELARIDAELIALTGKMRWVPNPGPQRTPTSARPM